MARICVRVMTTLILFFVLSTARIARWCGGAGCSSSSRATGWFISLRHLDDF